MGERWKLFDVLSRPARGSAAAAELALIMDHNLRLLRSDHRPIEPSVGASSELETLRLELTQAYAELAALAEDLDRERLRTSYLEERLAMFEDAVLSP